MKKLIGLLVGLALVATPALAQKITIDYAHDFDFAQVKTFQYVETKESNAPNSLMDDRIRDAIVKQLEAGGLEQVDSAPDIYVTYHLTTKDDTVFNTTGFGYGGFGLGWRAWGGGMATATTTESTSTEGTLIVDGYEAADKRLIWRGTGTVTVKDKPEKQIEQIDKVMTKLGERWQKILKNQGE